MDIDEFELIAAKGWRAPEEARLGQWLLRAAGGFTGRANSALAAGDPGLPLPDAVNAVKDWYAEKGLPAMIAVPYPLDRPEAAPADRYLGELGWSLRDDPATVLTAPAAAVASLAPDAPVRVDPEPDDAWLGLYHYRGQELPPIARRVLLSAPFQAFASVRRDGWPVAIGRVAVADGWAGLTAIEVAPDHRREGLATVITAALARVAAARGAAEVYLQVADGNHAARALYARCGFTARHGYRYRVGPA